MNIKANISISRWSNDRIGITIQDEASNIQFVDVSMNFSDFAEAITGHSNMPCEGEVRGLQYVGMERVCENRTVEYPLGGYNKADMRAWLETNCQEDGWLVNGYLGSQSSVIHKDGKTFLNYSVTKYVPVAEEAPE